MRDKIGFHELTNIIYIKNNTNIVGIWLQLRVNIVIYRIAFRWLNEQTSGFE